MPVEFSHRTFMIQAMKTYRTKDQVKIVEIQQMELAYSYNKVLLNHKNNNGL